MLQNQVGRRKFLGKESLILLRGEKKLQYYNLNNPPPPKKGIPYMKKNIEINFTKRSIAFNKNTAISHPSPEKTIRVYNTRKTLSIKLVQLSISFSEKLVQLSVYGGKHKKSAKNVEKSEKKVEKSLKKISSQI